MKIGEIDLPRLLLDALYDGELVVSAGSWRFNG